MTIISVVIPLYNKELSVQRAINSVLAQKYTNFELIIIDDGSTDRSFEFADQIIDPRIVKIQQKNQGVSTARNRGILEAVSEYVAFLDADDEWLPEFLENTSKLINEFPEADVFGSSYLIKQNNSIKTPPTYKLFEKDWIGLIPNYLEICNIGYMFNSSSVVIKKSALLKVGGFPSDINYGEDVDTWIRLSLNSQIAYINKPLSIYNSRIENRECTLNVDHLEVFYPVMQLQHYLNLGKIPNYQKQFAIEFIAKLNLPLAKRQLFHGNTNQAKELVNSCGPTKKHLIEKHWLKFLTYIPTDLLNIIIKLKHVVYNPLCQKFKIK